MDSILIVALKVTLDHMSIVVIVLSKIPLHLTRYTPVRECVFSHEKLTSCIRISKDIKLFNCLNINSLITLA